MTARTDQLLDVLSAAEVLLEAREDQLVTTEAWERLAEAVRVTSSTHQADLDQMEGVQHDLASG